MSGYAFQMIARILLFFTVVYGTAACSPVLAPTDSIQQAYNLPGLVAMKPYTRTIFSSSNF